MKEKRKSATKPEKAKKPRIREDIVTFEYLLVKYAADGMTVMANDVAVGVTNHILLLPTGDYTIALPGVPVNPASQDIGLSGTSPLRPAVVFFS